MEREALREAPRKARFGAPPNAESKGRKLYTMSHARRPEFATIHVAAAATTAAAAATAASSPRPGRPASSTTSTAKTRPHHKASMSVSPIKTSSSHGEKRDNNNNSKTMRHEHADMTKRAGLAHTRRLKITSATRPKHDHNTTITHARMSRQETIQRR